MPNRTFVVLLIAISVAHATRAEDADSTALIRAAQTAFGQGKQDEAVLLATKAVEANAKDPRALFFRARLYEALHQHEKSIADCDAALKFDSAPEDCYQLRGCENFRLGRMKESCDDFDAYLKLKPHQAPGHWQRGISLYYAGRYDDGRKQFELHQTVNPSDVENAVWHFLCVSRAENPAKARAALIPIDHDGRIPMMQVYALFKGELKPDDVLAAATAGKPSPEELNDQLFFAHLYLGLYYEATGDAVKAREHILKSADDYKSPHYMGDVARAHTAILRAKK